MVERSAGRARANAAVENTGSRSTGAACAIEIFRGPERHRLYGGCCRLQQFMQKLNPRLLPLPKDNNAAKLGVGGSDACEEKIGPGPVQTVARVGTLGRGGRSIATKQNKRAALGNGARAWNREVRCAARRRLCRHGKRDRTENQHCYPVRSRHARPDGAVFPYSMQRYASFSTTSSQTAFGNT